MKAFRAGTIWSVVTTVTSAFRSSKSRMVCTWGRIQPPLGRLDILGSYQQYAVPGVHQVSGDAAKLGVPLISMSRFFSSSMPVLFTALTGRGEERFQLIGNVCRQIGLIEHTDGFHLAGG